MNKPALGSFSSLSHLQTSFGLIKKSFVKRADFQATFAREKANGLTIGLFDQDGTYYARTFDAVPCWNYI